jgi:hypothetical protein
VRGIAEMNTWALTSIFVYAILLISGCAPTSEHAATPSYTKQPEHAESSSGAKVIFEDGEGPVKVTERVQPSTSGSASQRKSVATYPVSTSSQQSYMGLSYWIELIGSDGQMQRVTASRTFRSGDSIKLYLISNRSGYLYLINTGSTGRSSILFPYADNDNFVQANVPYLVPKDARILFDHNPGEERLLAILSPQPLTQKAGAITAPDKSSLFGSTLAQQGCKDLTIDTPEQLAQLGKKCGSKDLIVEEDVTGPAPAYYAVAPMSTLAQNGQVIAVQIRLQHI